MHLIELLHLAIIISVRDRLLSSEFIFISWSLLDVCFGGDVKFESPPDITTPLVQADVASLRACGEPFFYCSLFIIASLEFYLSRD